MQRTLFKNMENGRYCEVSDGVEVYSVFRYAENVSKLLKDCIFVMNKQDYLRVNAEYMNKANALFRINIDHGMYVAVKKINGQDDKKSLFGVIYGDCSGMFRNGVLIDMRRDNVMPVKKGSRGKHLLMPKVHDTILGHVIPNIYLPKSMKIKNNKVTLHIFEELSALYNVEKKTFSSVMNVDASNRNSCIRGLIHSLQTLEQRWVNHTRNGQEIDVCMAQANKYQQIIGVADIGPPQRTVVGVSDLINEAVRVLNNCLNEVPQLLPAEPEPEPAEEIKEEIDSKEELPMQELKEAIEEVAQELHPVMEGSARRINYQSAANGVQDLVVIDFGGNRVVVLDFFVFKVLHGHDNLARHELRIHARKYPVIRRTLIVDGRRLENFLHRYCMMNFVRTDAGAIIQQSREIPAGLTVDHANRVEYDNRMSNLRLLNQRHQNYNQNTKRRSINSVISKYFGIDIPLPTYLDIKANDTRNGSGIYKRTKIFREDYNVVAIFEIKLRTGKKTKVTKKINLVTIFKEYLKNRGQYADRLAQVNPDHRRLATDAQALPILLMTLELTQEEREYLYDTVRREIINTIDDVINEVRNNEVMHNELNYRQQFSDVSQGYREYLDICAAAGFQVEADQRRLNVPSYMEPCEQLITRLNTYFEEHLE